MKHRNDYKGKAVLYLKRTATPFCSVHCDLRPFMLIMVLCL